MTDAHAFDDARGHHLFLADAYLGGLAWEQPSSPTLGTAQLYTYTVHTPEDGPQTVVETPSGQERSYLVPWPGESAANFRRRRSLAVYINLAEPIGDAYADAVTGGVSRDLGALTPYLTSLDGEGQDWQTLVSSVCLWTAVHGVVAVVLDAPTANAAESRAEEIARGVSLRATIVTPAAWAWVRIDDDGCVVEFAYADQATVDSTALMQTVRVWVWSLAGWALYEHSCSHGSALGEQRDAVMRGTPKRAGPLSPRLSGKLPVVFAYNRRVTASRTPAGKSLVAGAASISRQVYQLLSSVEDTQRRAPSFLSIPTASKGALEPETQAKVGPDMALPAPEGAGTPSYVAYPPDVLAGLREHAMFLVLLAYRLAGLSVEADASIQVPSGEALRLKSRDFEARAKKLARSMADFERRALDVAGLYLGMDAAQTTITYPQRFVLADTSETLAGAILLMQTLGDRLGPTGLAETMRQAINAALTLDDKRLTEITDEMSVAPVAVDAADATGDADALAASGVAPGATAQDAALNGAQVKSMLEIVQAVAGLTLPRDAAAAIIERGFLVDASRAVKMLGSAGTPAFRVPSANSLPPSSEE